MHPNIKDLTGMRFGRLTVLSLTDKRHHHQVIWLCQCDCGKIVEVNGTYMRTGDTKSCGCLHDEIASRRLKDAMKTHGGYYDRLHGIWTDMLTRCKNPNSKPYPQYGGRGIKVCVEWDHSYQKFKDWAYANGYDETAPYGECTLDRIDVNGNYCPENCRFITLTEQSRNKTTTRNITIDGKTHCIAEWAEILGITPSTIGNAERLRGIPPEAYIKYRLTHRNIRRARTAAVLAASEKWGCG